MSLRTDRPDDRSDDDGWDGGLDRPLARRFDDGGGDDGDDGGDDGGIYETLPTEWSHRRRWSLTIAIVAGVILVALLAGGLYVKNRFDPPGPQGEPVEVQIPRGFSTNEIGDLLESKGVIPSATVFRTYVKYKGDGPFKAGVYHLRTNSAVWEVVDDLSKGPDLADKTSFRVEPGLTLSQLGGAVTDDLPNLDPNKFGVVFASGEVRSKYQTNPSMGYEGFLAPDTYDVPENVTELLVVQLMIDQFDRMADEAGLGRSQELVGYDSYSVLIIASMIEREAKVPGDRAKVAGVIYNRLEIDMALGIDATLCYAKTQFPAPPPAPGTAVKCQLLQSDRDSPSPYNTGNKQGLPPTPIAMVSAASLKAALHPDRGEPGEQLLYYVLDPDLPEGQHFFTSSYQEFLEAKQRCHDAGLGCG